MIAAVVTAKGRILASREASTEAVKGDWAAAVDQIADTIQKACRKARVRPATLSGVGVGAAGAVDIVKGVVVSAPNLGWSDAPVTRALSRKLGVDVHLDNDVHVALIGEHALGAARGAKNAVAIWVGTGIGGGILVDGRLHYGSRGSAGEIGHMVIQVDGPICGCGRRGCAESLASRTAMERDVRALSEAGQRSAALRIMDEIGKTRMTSSVIQKAIDETDPIVLQVLARAQKAIGVLVSNLVNVLDPELVVIGGGIAERLGDLFVGPIRQFAYEGFIRQSDRETVRIVTSTLGDRAGALGAAFMARDRS